VRLTSFVENFMKPNKRKFVFFHFAPSVVDISAKTFKFQENFIEPNNVGFI
jgi:hypothetical protein